VARREGWPDSDLIVNLQGDEPLIAEALIDQVAALLAREPPVPIWRPCRCRWNRSRRCWIQCRKSGHGRRPAGAVIQPRANPMVA